MAIGHSSLFAFVSVNLAYAPGVGARRGIVRDAPKKGTRRVLTDSSGSDSIISLSN
jgi:hypothetical protein